MRGEQPGGGEGPDQGLTTWDHELLDRYLPFYRSLERGDRKPATAQQRHFVAVCRGEAEPTTQHEIAYARYRRTAAQDPAGPGDVDSPPAPWRASSDAAAADPRDEARFQRRSQVIDRIDALTGRLPNGSAILDAMSKLRGKIQQTVGWAGEKIGASVPLITAIANDPELTRAIERWSAESFNTISSVYSTAMDGAYAEGLRAGTEYLSPNLHRLFGGHTPVEACAAVCDALPNDSLAEEFVGYLFAMGSDFASVIGLPFTTFSPDTFARFSEVLQNFGLSQDWIVDILHQNSTEFLGAAFPSVCAVLAFNSADQQRFAHIAGSLGVAAIASANPLGGLAALIMIGLAYRRAIAAENESALALGVGQGALTGGSVLAISAIVGGPAIVGILVAVAASMAVRKYSARLNVDEARAFVSETARRAWKSWGSLSMSRA